VHPRFRTPAVAIGLYALVCAFVSWTGSFRQLIVVGTSGTLVLYLICCVGLFPLRARNVAAHGTPFLVPGGSAVPLAAAGIIVWMLSTLAWSELAAAAVLVAVSGAVYCVQYRWQRRAVARVAVSNLSAGR
jgi:basic amino acid/polyamine antiporter, APA family